MILSVKGDTEREIGARVCSIDRSRAVTDRDSLTYFLDVFIVVAYGSNNHVTVES